MTTPANTKTLAFTTTPYAHTSPPREKLTAATKIFNVALTLDQARKLQLGLQEGIQQLLASLERFAKQEPLAV